MAANLTFTDIQTRVMNALRLPTTDSTHLTRVAAIMNEVYRDIGARYRHWWWRQARTVVNTATPFNSGNVTASYGSVSITFSVTPPSEYGSFLNRVLLVDGSATDSAAVYRIAAHSTGSATASLDAAYTNVATTTSFNVYQDAYDLPADCASVRFVQRFGFADPLKTIGPEEMEHIKSYRQLVGKPQVWTVFESRTSGDPTTPRQIVYDPYPDAVYRTVVFYERTLNTELSGTTRPLIPDDYAQVLIYGTLARAYPIMLNDIERGQVYERLFNDLVAGMLKQQREQEGNPKVEVRDNYRSFYRRGRRVTAQTSDLGSMFDRWPIDP